ncbi:heat shock protein 67B1 [Lucilia cuprina]|uniref:heat shock protein 67B1 n=1 Tax=Lucilia cuprina TaxID=7375 RepID=UPI001F066405|nr:heat shock protein 67B1 [Lucilia cuprina]
MSLIPFILDLADELHEFSRCLANGIDINDFGFGLYTGTDQHQQPQQHQQQQQQQQQQQHQPQTSPRRSRTSSFSSFWMPSKRHHPYNRIKTACCAKSGEETVAGTPENSGKEASGSSSVVGAGGGTPGKSASYSVVNKNGFQVSMNVKQFAPNELSVKTIDNCIVVEGRHDDKEDGHGVISRHFVRKYMLPKGYDPNDVLSTLSSDGILTVKAPPPPPPTAKNDEPNERIIEIQPTPGPTPVLVVSAKDITVKETSKKLPTTPSARLECQLPEKRQKLDLPPETEPEESVTSSAPIPTTNTVNETDAASVVVAGTEEVVNDDVEMEKADEQINEIVLKQTEQQQQSNVEEIEKNDVEKKAENIEQAEKQIAAKKQEEQAEIVDETEKKLLDECMSDSNGDTKNVCEKMEESTSITDATKAATEKTNESAAATKLEESSNEKSNVAKMEVDEEVDKDVGQRKDNVAKKTDNTEIFVAILKTCSVKTAVKPAATAVGAADSAKQKKETETTNNTDTSSSSSTTTTTTNTTNNNNNTSTNSNNTNTTTNNNLTSTDVATENSAKDVKDGNGVVTGEISDDIPKSANTDSDSAAATATAKISTDNSSKAESVADGDVEMETAVLSTDTTTTTTNIIDNVALLKAATADPADITDNNAEQNDILTESMDGITTTADSNTTATTVDNVECSLFAKKSHLGNGNNTTATPLVATEEMAN